MASILIKHGYRTTIDTIFYKFVIFPILLEDVPNIFNPLVPMSKKN